MTAQEHTFCHFCAKNREEVFTLVAGPRVAICDECVALCVDVIADERRAATPPSGSVRAGGREER